MICMKAESTARQAAWKMTTLIWVVAVHLLLLFFIVKTQSIPKVITKLTNTNINADPYVSRMVNVHRWMDASVPDKATIFLGDSITQGLATVAIAPYSVNYGIGDENTAQLLEAIPSYKSLARANTIFLAIGINDLSHGQKLGLSDRYRKIVEALPAKTPLVWSAVMPAKSGNITLTDINQVNEVIKAMCVSRANCTYVDTWRFLAKDNEINSHLFQNDGVHLNADGYEVWIVALRKALQAISHPA